MLRILCEQVWSKRTVAPLRLGVGDANGSCLPVGEIAAEAAFEDSVEDQARLARFCKTLGYPVRVRSDIVEKLPLAQSTVSQHLKVLKEAGLIKGAIDGPRTCYCLDREVLSEFKGLSDALL